MSTLYSEKVSAPEQELDESEPEEIPGTYVTFALIVINIAVFIAVACAGASPISHTGHPFASWAANFSPLRIEGQWWLLLAACFLHFGIVSLAFSMFILFEVGVFAERLLGSSRFLLLYLLSGVGGNIAGLYFHHDSVNAGASGAIFGIYAGLLAFRFVQPGDFPKAEARGLAKYAVIFIIYNLVFGLTRPVTDFAAHIGGLVTGFVCGCFLAAPLSPEGLGPRLLHIGRIAVVAVGGTALAIVAVEKLPKGALGGPSQTVHLLSSKAK